MNIIIPGVLLCGLLIILVLWAYGSRNHSNNKILAISLFFVWYVLFINHMNIQGYIFQFPHLTRTALIAGYLAVPFLYIYIRNTFYPGKIWQSTDWLMMISPAFYIIDMFPYFLLSGAEKTKMLSTILRGVQLKMQVTQGWISPGWLHYGLLYSVSGFLMVLIVKMIIQNQKLEGDRVSTTNKPLFSMIIMLAFTFSLMTFPGLIGALLGVDWFNMHFIAISLSFPFLGVFIYLIFSHHVLYGFLYKPAVPLQQQNVLLQTHPKSPANDKMVEINLQQEGESEIEMQASERYNNYQIENIYARLSAFMETEKPFLKHSVLIHDISRDLNIPVYMLSKVINQKMGINFNRWLNKYRVDYFLTLYQNTDNQYLTLEALAQKAGFLSRITFIKCFKAEKNETPSQYIRTHFKKELI